MNQQPTNCVLRHREPREARHGYLCAGHYRWLRSALNDVLVTAAMLPAFLEQGSVERDPHLPPTKNHLDPPVPIRLEVVALSDRRTGAAVNRGDITPALAILESWARIVREDQALASPTTQATLMTEAGLLGRHADYIAAQPWIDDLAAELRGILGAMHAAIGDYAPRPVGRCQADVDDGVCGGALLQDRYGMLSVTCRKCGDNWSETELRRLGLLLDQGRDTVR